MAIGRKPDSDKWQATEKGRGLNVWAQRFDSRLRKRPLRSQAVRLEIISGRPLTPSLSPPDGVRVAAGRVRRARGSIQELLSRTSLFGAAA